MEKKYAIVTFSKTHFLITEREHERLRDKKLGDFFTMDDMNSVRTNDIAEVLNIRDYYDQYPDKRPPQVPPEFKTEPGRGLTGMIIHEKRAHALRGIIRGLEKYINGKYYQGTDAPLVLLKLAKSRLQECTH